MARGHHGSRATSTEELESIFWDWFNLENVERGLAFQPRPSDIIISPYPKCGSTWLQQITHGLRTRGSMDFDEINTVVPWIEVAYDVGWDLEAPQVAEPRVFKCHRSWHDVPKGARYICVFRHYHDAIVSCYRFFEGWYFEPGTIDLATFTNWWWPREEVAGQHYWFDLGSWWEQRHNNDVLLLCYEDMKADLPATIKAIAHFMGITLDDELLNIVIRQSSREFMLAHRDQFDERHMREIGGKRAGLPPATETHKVTSGISNKAHHQLSESLKLALDDIWREQIQTKYGFESYEQLRQDLKDLHQTGKY